MKRFNSFFFHLNTNHAFACNFVSNETNVMTLICSLALQVILTSEGATANGNDLDRS